MENKYKKYQEFWYRKCKDIDSYWKISREEDDRKCDKWMFSAKKFTLKNAIKKIKQDELIEKVAIEIIHKFGASYFLDFAEFIVNENKKLDKLSHPNI